MWHPCENRIILKEEQCFWFCECGKSPPPLLNGKHRILNAKNRILNGKIGFWRGEVGFWMGNIPPEYGKSSCKIDEFCKNSDLVRFSQKKEKNRARAQTWMGKQFPTTSLLNGGKFPTQNRFSSLQWEKQWRWTIPKQRGVGIHPSNYWNVAHHSCFFTRPACWSYPVNQYRTPSYPLGHSFCRLRKRQRRLDKLLLMVSMIHALRCMTHLSICTWERNVWNHITTFQ